MSPLSSFSCEWEPVCCAFSVPSCAKALFLSLPLTLSLCSESQGEAVSRTGPVTVSGWDRCLLDERRPVTRSRSPAWAYAPRGCGEDRGMERGYTGNQQATWGPVRPMHKTWTSHNHGWCHLVSQTCSEGSVTIRSWSRPHMCKGRWCSKFLPERKSQT